MPGRRYAAFHAAGDVDPAVVAHDGDSFFCGALASDCSSREAFLAQERPLYAGAPCLDPIVMPGVGHDVNLHPSAPTYQERVLTWADAVVAGGCPDGP